VGNLSSTLVSGRETLNCMRWLGVQVEQRLRGMVGPYCETGGGNAKQSINSCGAWYMMAATRAEVDRNETVYVAREDAILGTLRGGMIPYLLYSHSWTLPVPSFDCQLRRRTSWKNRARNAGSFNH